MRQVHVVFWDRSDGGKLTVPGCRITAERNGDTRGTGADPLYEHDDPETFRMVSCAMQLLEMAARRADERRVSRDVADKLLDQIAEGDAVPEVFGTPATVKWKTNQ